MANPNYLRRYSNIFTEYHRRPRRNRIDHANLALQRLRGIYNLHRSEDIVSDHSTRVLAIGFNGLY